MKIIISYKFLFSWLKIEFERISNVVQLLQRNYNTLVITVQQLQVENSTLTSTVRQLQEDKNLLASTVQTNIDILQSENGISKTGTLTPYIFIIYPRSIRTYSS